MKTISPSCYNLKCQNGFSIIEILIGMCILSFGILAIGTMQIAAVKNNKLGNTYTQASTLARAQMELIKNADIDDTAGILNPGAFPTTSFNADNPLDENGQPGGIYNLSWTVDNYLQDTDGDGVGDTASEFGRLVTVTVTFPFMGDNNRQISLTSVVAGGGI